MSGKGEFEFSCSCPCLPTSNNFSHPIWSKPLFPFTISLLITLIRDAMLCFSIPSWTYGCTYYLLPIHPPLWPLLHGLLSSNRSTWTLVFSVPFWCSHLQEHLRFRSGSFKIAHFNPHLGHVPCPAWLLWEPTEGRLWVRKTPGAMGVVLRFAWAMPKALGRAVYSWSARLPDRASCFGSGGGWGEEEVRGWGAVAGVGADTVTMTLESWGRGCSASFSKGFFLIYFFFWAFCNSWNTSQVRGMIKERRKEKEKSPRK